MSALHHAHTILFQRAHGQHSVFSSKSLHSSTTPRWRPLGSQLCRFQLAVTEQFQLIMQLHHQRQASFSSLLTNPRVYTMQHNACRVCCCESESNRWVHALASTLVMSCGSHVTSCSVCVRCLASLCPLTLSLSQVLAHTMYSTHIALAKARELITRMKAAVVNIFAF
jgi:hypothetical protein